MSCFIHDDPKIHSGIFKIETGKENSPEFFTRRYRGNWVDSCQEGSLEIFKFSEVVECEKGDLSVIVKNKHGVEKVFDFRTYQVNYIIRKNEVEEEKLESKCERIQ